MWITDQVTEICVDDFALRKRMSYGTIIIDSKSHRVIDMIKTRERADVTAKLTEYPNLKVVSRDGSPTYASAITETNPDILQISDRFHLLKGLTEACKTVIQELFSVNIAITKSSVTENDISEYNSSYWEKKPKKDAPEKEHDKKVEKKRKLVQQVRELSGKGLHISDIAKETGISYSTVKRYLRENYSPENAGYGRKQPSMIKPYEKDIKKMLMEKRTFKEIGQEIRNKGYTGSASAIRMYATRERRLIKQAAGIDSKKTILERKWLVKLLYKPGEELKGIDNDVIDQLLEEYPVMQDIYDIVGSFRDILFSKKTDDIDKWIEEVNSLGIEEIISYANGLRRDIEAVKNAARHDYNNGLAEGSVNKLKLEKRKMYGRCSFETLRKRILLREQYKIIQQT